MSLLMINQHGLPHLVDSDDLLSIDDHRAVKRILEIAAALEREGYEGIRVQCIPIENGRYVYSLNVFHGSIGERLIEFFADYARDKKIIFSVEVALHIAKLIQE